MAFITPNIGNNTAHVNGYLTASTRLPQRSLYRAMLNEVLARVEERLREVGLTAAAASTQAGLSKDAIRNMQRAIENKGRAGVSTKTIYALAPVLRTTPGWLLGDDHQADDETVDVPLLAGISAGTFRDHDGVKDADIERHVKVSHLPRGEWFALTVEGDSMNRIAPDGAVIIVNRADKKLVDGEYYVFALDDGAATFKRFRRDPEPMLVPWSFNPDHYALPVGSRDLYVFGRVRKIIYDL